MTVTKILGAQAGIQYQGVQDKSEADPRDHLINALFTGEFKNGPLSKPFKVTAANIRKTLGFDPDNLQYQAIEDCLKQGVPFVWVMRYKPMSSSNGMSCIYFTNEWAQLAVDTHISHHRDDNIYSTMEIPALTEANIIALIDQIQGFHSHMFYTSNATSPQKSALLGTIQYDVEYLKTKLKEAIPELLANTSYNLGNSDFYIPPEDYPNITTGLDTVITAINNLALNDGGNYVSSEAWFAITWYKVNDGTKDRFYVTIHHGETPFNVTTQTQNYDSIGSLDQFCIGKQDGFTPAYIEQDRFGSSFIVVTPEMRPALVECAMIYDLGYIFIVVAFDYGLIYI